MIWYGANSRATVTLWNNTPLTSLLFLIFVFIFRVPGQPLRLYESGLSFIEGTKIFYESRNCVKVSENIYGG